jgi:hypothetical protein
LREIFFFFGGTGLWTQGLTLATQALYHLSHFASSVFEKDWRRILRKAKERAISHRRKLFQRNNHLEVYVLLFNLPKVSERTVELLKSPCQQSLVCLLCVCIGSFSCLCSFISKIYYKNNVHTTRIYFYTNFKNDSKYNVKISFIMYFQKIF